MRSEPGQGGVGVDAEDAMEAADCLEAQSDCWREAAASNTASSGGRRARSCRRAAPRTPDLDLTDSSSVNKIDKYNYMN